MKCPTCKTTLNPQAHVYHECGHDLRTVPPSPSFGVTAQHVRRRYRGGAIAGLAILGWLGFMGYRVFSEDWAYERSLESRTPEQRFFLRAQNGETEEVQSLLAAGMSPNTKDDATGATALILAGVGGYTETVKLLLKAGADVNAQDHNGMTALIGAAHWGRVDTAKVRIAAGADVNTQRQSGITALTIARKAGREEVVQLLQAAGAQE